MGLGGRGPFPGLKLGLNLNMDMLHRGMATHATDSRRIALCLVGYPRTFLRPLQQQAFGRFLSQLRNATAQLDLFAVFSAGYEDNIKGSLFRADEKAHSRVLRERWNATWLEWSGAEVATPCGSCWSQWGKFARCGEALRRHEERANATYDCVIKARPDLDYLPGAGAALLRACADPRARRRPVMQTFKDDRLFALQRPALERIVAMHDRTIESGRCAGAPGTAACVGLMQEYCRSEHVKLERFVNLAWIHRPVEAQFFLRHFAGSPHVSLGAHNISSWRDAAHLTQQARPPGCNETACEAPRHLKCNATNCRLFFEGEEDRRLDRQYSAPGMLPVP